MSFSVSLSPLYKKHWAFSVLSYIYKTVRYVNLTIVDEVVVVSVTSSYLLQITNLLRNSSLRQFEILVDIIVVDYPYRLRRFQLVYIFLSLNYNARIYVKINLLDSMSIASLTSLFSNAYWFERQAWDMFGIIFSNHMDLRRILTDYGFWRHPLRKDFPLLGYDEVRYSENERRVVTEALEMSQEFRVFDYPLSWSISNMK